jgi:predicted RNA-binding Zn-ribbon protein involved in translation (DUF1610 family)
VSGYRLVSLSCPSCGAPIAAESQDEVFYCTACRNGYVFDLAEQRLRPVEVSFVLAPERPVERYLPFWAIPARTRLLQHSQRPTEQGPSIFAAEAGTFVIPAYATPIEHARELALRYTREFPRLGERLGERLTGGRFGVVDAQKLAEVVLVYAEAQGSGTLTELRYEIQFGPARLLGVPFVGEPGSYADAHFGLLA